MQYNADLILKNYEGCERMRFESRHVTWREAKPIVEVFLKKNVETLKFLGS